MAGGTPLTITGTGFVTGTAVNFVEETNGTQASDNTVLTVPASSVTVNSGTQITAPSPSMTEGSTYFVTVTTPIGTSAYDTVGGQPIVFTYVPISPPTVSSVSTTGGTSCGSGGVGAPTGVTACGSIAGGATVTITGTGFYTVPYAAPVPEYTTVNFVEETNGVKSSPSVIVPVSASLITVLSDTTMTVVAPPVNVGTTYWVEVTTPGNTTNIPSTSSQSDVFYYAPLTPTVNTVSPTTGPLSGTTTGNGFVTITGTGFIPGATVWFEPQKSCAAPNSASTGNGSIQSPAGSVTISSDTSITAGLPTGKSGTTLYPVVSDASGTSSCYPSFEYTSNYTS